MKKLLYFIFIIILMAVPVCSLEFEAPKPPESAEEYIPDETGNFSEDILFVVKSALKKIQPDITEAGGVCLSIAAAIICTGIIRDHIPMVSRSFDLAGTAAVAILLIDPSRTLIQAGLETVREMNEYGKILFPVLCGALSAQGGVTTAGLLYTGTMVFTGLLSGLISKVVTPMLYCYLVLCIACGVLSESVLKKLKALIKWCITWGLKIVLYVFMGYMGISGVISGSADAAALKATKLAISGVVPVVGKIMADASETILLSTSVMKNTVGTYGVIVILSLLIGPFLKCGVYYILLKLVCAVCGLFDSPCCTSLVKDASGVMGFVLAMTGVVGLMLMVSVVCFMKGAAL